MYRYEGARALFRGLGPTLAGVVPARSINFFVYGNGKHVFADALYDGDDTRPVVHLLSAAVAGVATAAATNPLWVVKTHLQLAQRRQKQEALSQSASSSTATTTTTTMTTGSSSSGGGGGAVTRGAARPTSWSVTREIARTEGIKGFYRGLSASLLGVTEGTLQWALYEQFKALATAPSSRSSSSGSRKRQEQQQQQQLDGKRISLAAGAAKLCATIVTYPHEVVRTRLRQPRDAVTGVIKYTSLTQACRLVWREEGWRAFYGGMSAHLLRVVPNAVTMFYVYEAGIRLFANETNHVAERQDAAALDSTSE